MPAPEARSRAKAITKRDLLELLSQKSTVSRKDVNRFLQLFTGLISDALKAGEKVLLSPFGTFDTRLRKARAGRNPQNGKPILIREARVPVFRPGRMLRKSIV